jgi:hypothetical protein
VTSADGCCTFVFFQDCVRQEHGYEGGSCDML